MPDSPLATPDDPVNGVKPTESDAVTPPGQPPMDDDASDLPDKEADMLGDFA